MSGEAVQQLRRRLIEVFRAVEGTLSGEAWRRDRELVARLGRLIREPEQRDALLAAPDVEAFARQAVATPEAPPQTDARAPDGEAAAADGTDEACTRPAVAERVDAFFDGTLSPPQMDGLWSHLAACAACRRRYQDRWDAEGAEARRKRLFRGLPWSEAATGAPDPQDAVPDEDLEAAEGAAAAVAPTGWRRWLTPSRITLGVGLVLAVVGVVGLLTLDPEPPRSGAQDGGVPVLDPDSALTVSLFRYDTTGRFEEPWRMVQGSVGLGERLMAAVSWAGRGPVYLTVLLVDDQGHRTWILPRGGPRAGHRTSARLRGPLQAARLPGAVQLPDGTSRAALYGVLTRRPLRLHALVRLLQAAQKAPDFFTQPPRLAIPGSLQARFALDVLR